MKSSFIVIPRVTTPVVHAGEKIEIEIYISGYGPMKQNKMDINYHAKELINTNDPGVIMPGIGIGRDATSGEPVMVLRGKPYVEHYEKAYPGGHKLDRWGLTTILHEGFFADVRKLEASESRIAFMSMFRSHHK